MPSEQCLAPAALLSTRLRQGRCSIRGPVHPLGPRDFALGMAAMWQSYAFADRRNGGSSAPFPELPCLTPERGRSTQTRASRPRQRVVGSAGNRVLASGSPLCGNRRLGQFVEQRLGLLEVGGVEAFGEPGVDRGEEGDRLLRPALLSAQAGEARCGAQFPGFRVRAWRADRARRAPRTNLLAMQA